MLGWLRILNICERNDATAISMSRGLPFRPLLPIVAAGPSGHDQHALLVREIVEIVALHFSFEANRIQIQIADVAELRFQSLGRLAEQHVRRPSAAANQDSLAVHLEESMALRVHLGCDFADAETDCRRIGNLAADAKSAHESGRSTGAPICRGHHNCGLMMRSSGKSSGVRRTARISPGVSVTSCAKRGAFDFGFDTCP